MNVSATSSEISADDYYKRPEEVEWFEPWQQNLYTWKKEIYEGQIGFDWNNLYQQVYYANTVLSGMTKINKTPANEAAWNAVAGSAYFFRAFSNWQLAENFAKPYNQNSAVSDKGILLRTSDDINIRLSRSTVQQTWEAIVSDLEQAVAMLPQLPSVKTRPSKAAAATLLARVYLVMGNYNKALELADLGLSLQSALVNFNSLNPASSAPFKLLFDETIFHCQVVGVDILFYDALIDTVLYQSYADNDLRKTLYFNKLTGNEILFKGNYTGRSDRRFGGMAVDELYLIRAECKARKNQAAEAMNDLNILLFTRWKSGTFVDYTAADGEQALRIILEERRKELLFRNLRWSDLRRLNQDNRFAKVLTRNISGTIYTLPPNHPNYVLPIPEIEINQSGIEQNPRQ
jgi:starch-binding outer membrane protein, SusD/RagB family